jgi:hypothetical protein
MRVERPARERVDVHPVRPQAVAAERQAGHAPHSRARVVGEVAGDHAREWNGAATEEDRVAIVLEDLDPAVEPREVLLQGAAVARIRGAWLVERMRVAALPRRELGPHPWVRPLAPGRVERVVVGEVEDATASGVGRGTANAERLVAGRQVDAARARAPASAQEIEPPQMEGGVARDGCTGGTCARGDQRERLATRHAHVAEIAPPLVAAEREVVGMRREQRARQELDERVAAPLDLESAAHELLADLRHDPVGVVRVADELEARGPALRHPVDEGGVARQAVGQPFRHGRVPGLEIRGIDPPREGRARRQPRHAARRGARVGHVLVRRAEG